jgi:hypothetical protein
MSLDDPNLREVADRIRAYLDRHPEAADTAEWIGRWWLTQQQVAVPAAMVQRALDGLVEAGEVRRTELPGKPPVYGRARAAPASGPGVE